MNIRSQLVIVAETPGLANDLRTWLVADGYRPTVATTYASAKVHLQTRPRLVISQMKLGEYNGLHVALRARAEGIPTVVVGESDMVLERDAREFGVTYVTLDELRRDRILDLARDMIPSTRVVMPAPKQPRRLKRTLRPRRSAGTAPVMRMPA
jgi:DNA-binding NtrC family response regulator